MKKLSEKQEVSMTNKIYYVSAKPWKECPFKCSLVVLTKNGEGEVIRIWREFFHNPDLEPEELSEVPFVKGEVDEELAS